MTVHFGDCDPAGVIFYPRAFELAHVAVEEFIRKKLEAEDAWFASPKHTFPVRRAEADFLGPMRPGADFHVSVSVEGIGTTSVTLAVKFADSAGTAVLCVRTIHVAVDRVSGKATSIPAEIRRKLC